MMRLIIPRNQKENGHNFILKAMQDPVFCVSERTECSRAITLALECRVTKLPCGALPARLGHGRHGGVAVDVPVGQIMWEQHSL